HLELGYHMRELAACGHATYRVAASERFGVLPGVSASACPHVRDSSSISTRSGPRWTRPSGRTPAPHVGAGRTSARGHDVVDERVDLHFDRPCTVNGGFHVSRTYRSAARRRPPRITPPSGGDGVRA